jgi:hypothetical protein
LPLIPGLPFTRKPLRRQGSPQGSPARSVVAQPVAQPLRHSFSGPALARNRGSRTRRRGASRRTQRVPVGGGPSIEPGLNLLLTRLTPGSIPTTGRGKVCAAGVNCEPTFRTPAGNCERSEQCANRKGPGGPARGGRGAGGGGPQAVRKPTARGADRGGGGAVCHGRAAGGADAQGIGGGGAAGGGGVGHFLPIQEFSLWVKSAPADPATAASSASQAAARASRSIPSGRATGAAR